MVDFVGDQAGDPAFEDGDAVITGDVLVFDVNDHRAGNQAADIEEAQAAFVLLVAVFAAFDDLGIEQGDHVVAAGRSDDGRGSLWARK